jgi:predicted transcriptional regulator
MVRTRARLPSLAASALLLVSLGLAMFATTAMAAGEDTPPTMHVLLDSSGASADVALGSQQVGLNGRVEVEKQGVGGETIHMTIEGVTWASSITPSEVVVRGMSDSFTFGGHVVVPSTADEGVNEVEVTATWFDIDGIPHSSSSTFTVRVVKLPFTAHAEPDHLVIPAGESRTVSIIISDHSLVSQTYLCQVRTPHSIDPIEWLRFAAFYLDTNRLDLEPGSEVSITFEIYVPHNATDGTFRVPVAISVDGHPDYVKEVDVSVIVQGVPFAPPKTDGEESWLPFDIMYIYWIVGLSIVVGVVGVLGFTEVGMLAVLWTLLLPLFTRLKRQEVLNQFTRGEIFGFIKANPGVHLTSIKENLDLSNGVLAYHLRVLVREEFIVARREGGYKRFYPRDMRIPRKRVHFSRLQMDILEKLRMHPGATQAALARMLGESKQVVHYNLGVLIAAEVVRVERDGSRTCCYITKDAPEMTEAEGDEVEDFDEQADPIVVTPSPIRMQ